MQQGATFSWTITRKQVSRDLWLLRSRPVIALWVAYQQNLFQNYKWVFLATWDKMVMKCLPKCGQIYYQEETLPTTNWCLLRAFAREGNGNPLQYSCHGEGILVGCSPWGCEELDTTERLHFHFSLSCIGEGNGNPLQCSCLENPRDGRAWWAAIYGVAQSWTRLKWLSSSSIHLSGF